MQQELPESAKARVAQFSTVCSNDNPTCSSTPATGGLARDVSLESTVSMKTPTRVKQVGLTATVDGLDLNLGFFNLLRRVHVEYDRNGEVECLSAPCHGLRLFDGVSRACV